MPCDVLLQAALPEELGPVLEVLTTPAICEIGPWRFWSGRILGLEVVLSRTDEGPLNAAAATALGLHSFQPQALINYGIAGAHDPALRKGDLIVGTEAVDYSGFRSSSACEGEGIDCGRWAPKPHKIRTGPDTVTPFHRFCSDPALVELARRLPYAGGRVLSGTVGTALQFNLEVDRILWIRKTYGTDTADQETAYAAGVAAAMGVPFMPLRVISDTVFNDPVLEKAFGAQSAHAALLLLRAIADSRQS
ncbi:MAG TPA: 5'-methylthioadenosine/S-adenosylhomocysteine nucleosidase [Bryobacteraceae bacterium]|nr:5'-methylthioadenosine/S-adenosylhomocysteine nucleosidase [Bryobacteraceae bacterium]